LGPRWKTRQRAIADHSAKPDCGPQRHDRAELVVTGQPWKGANATALKAIATAENQMRHGKVFNLRDQDDGSHRIWSAKVADPHGRQCNLTISYDGSSVVSLNEDKTPDDDVRTLRSAKIPLEDAINTAVEHARGKGNLTSLEIDIKKSATAVWQIEFGGDHGTTVLVDGTTVLVDANSGEVLDTDPDTA
jgi:uncharacterized membrane protein YkoI